jgi:hypothetical protein
MDENTLCSDLVKRESAVDQELFSSGIQSV